MSSWIIFKTRTTTCTSTHTHTRGGVADWRYSPKPKQSHPPSWPEQACQCFFPFFFLFPFWCKNAHTHTQMQEGSQADWGLSPRQGDKAICLSKGLIQPKAQATNSSIFQSSRFCLHNIFFVFLFCFMFFDFF